MKRKIIRRFVSLLLILCMAVSMLPMSLFAATTSGDVPVASLLQETQNPFTDVSKTDWFYDAVMYAKQNDIFRGTSTNSFSPEGTMTRAMYVTVLGKIAGVDTSKYKTSEFSDVTMDMWYAPYVTWAADRGITAGTGDGSFSPNQTITREQMATQTVKYFESYKIKYQTDGQITSQPKDISTISPWALDSVLKLWNAGLFKGDTEGNFNPRSNATRAEAASFSKHTSETVKVWTIKNQTTPTPIQTLIQTLTPTATPSQASTPTSSIQTGNSGYRRAITYTLTFNTDGGNSIDSQTLDKGTILNNLPTPYKMNYIFLGWYKDSVFLELIKDTDTLTSDMTLYAKYAAGSIDETQSIPSISKLDQDKGFTIGVDDVTGNMTAEQIKAAMTFESPTNPDFEGIEVTGSGGHFTVVAQGGNFEEGASYKLTLKDENLSFTGEDKSTTIYTFTISRQTVMNLGLSSGLVYIPALDVNDMTQNGESVSELSVPLASVDNSGTDLSTVDLNSGTFSYSGTGIEVGSTVVIYDGIRPDQRDLNTGETDSGTVAYVTITAINGNTYTYESADSKDVLFTPDILPVSNIADTDGDTNNHSITVDKSIMNYSDVEYSQMGLNADTTLDAGDFVSFYTGTLGDDASTIAGYGKITEVTTSENNYIIAYTDATEDQVTGAMDLYSQKYVEGEKLLENADVPALEEQIEQQAIDSGFVNQASQYLAAMALDTDSFKNLNSDFDLKSYNVSISDGTPVSDDQVMLMAGSKVKVENKTIHARLSTKLKHFKDLSGVRCALEIACDIVIDAGESNEIVIHVSGTFEQEVRIKIGASGGAIWKKKWIIPYIADYRLNANIDAYTYTGISINANIGTFEKDEEWDWDDKSKVQNIGKQIKELMDKKDEYIGDGIDTVSGTLADKYSKMLENDSDWIDLFDKEIFSQESSVDPFHILVCGVTVSFVVSAKMNVSLGCDFYYENAKRYIFNIQIFSQKRSNDTINLVEEKYQFTFYVMGTLGLRAGIRLEISTGLFSLKLNSIGFVVEAGAYVELWGYFYYEFTYTASKGKTSKYSGALYLEFGIYLEISFKAQLLKGTFEYNPTLYENQWPLLFAGSQQNVHDFSYIKDDAPKVSMAKKTTSFVLPDSTFKMSYMDMKTGETSKKTYDDSKDFTIKMTNGAFKYNPDNNTVTVTPGSKIIENGEMIVTWKGAPLAFTSTPISRTIPLYWDNLKNAYSISFNTSGGSAVGAISLPYNTSIKAPADPQKMGYVFGGWYKDQNCTQAYIIPAQMPAEDIVLYAKWTQATNTKYTVEHYQQNLINDLYTLTDTDSLTGTTDANVNPSQKIYLGYTAPTTQSITIKADGSEVLKLYYKRNSYTLTFDANEGQGGSTAPVKYGASIAAPVITKAGYTFTGWSPAVASTMPAQNTTYTAQWTASEATAYKVEHYQQNINDNNYTLAETENLSGTTATTATATAKSYTGFTNDSSVLGTVESGAIAGDGSLVLKLYYTRNSYTLTFNANGGMGGSATEVKYGASITAPVVTMEGYTHTGWSPSVASTMPAQNTTYTGQWTASEATAYKVEHYQQNINDNNYTLAETENLSGTTATTATATAKSYTGFTYDSSVLGTVESGAIAGDGSLVLKQYYTRNSYTLTFNANGGMGGSATEVKYGASITAPVVTKEGYTHTGWSPDVASTMPAENTTYTAQWTESEATAYKVEHYKQNINDNNYTLAEMENLSGTTGATATATAKSYTGFTYDSSVLGTVESGAIAGDGSLVLKQYYTRNSYTLTFNANGGIGGSATEVKYGASITAPVVTKAGYTFTDWSPDVASTMPAENVTYTAQWTASEATAYKVEHYKQNINDNNYTLAETENLSGTIGETATATAKSYTGFTYDINVSGTIESGTIAGDGSLVLKLYYTRNSYTLTFDANGGMSGSTAQVKYGADITAPVVTKAGYTHTGWLPAVSSTMPAENTTYAAQWAIVNYKISFDKNAADADGSMADQSFSGVAAQNLTANGYTRSSYTFTGWNTVADGSGTKYENKASVSSLTTVDNDTVILYAQWKTSSSSGIFNSQYSAKYQVFDFIVSGTKINGNSYDSSWGTAGASSGHQFSDAMLAGRYFVIRKTEDATNRIALYMYEADGTPVVQGTSANLYPSSLIGSDNNVNLTASCKTSLSVIYGADWAKGLVAVGNISSLWDEGFQFTSANGFGYFISGKTAYSIMGAITLNNKISNPSIEQIEAVNDFEAGPLTAPN